MGRIACERLLGFTALNATYRVAHRPSSRRGFCESALRALGVRFDVAGDDLARVPRSGPLVVVANHPFGGLDGLVLAALLQRVRPDVRLLANYLLACMPEMRASCFFVDPFGGPGAAARNLASMRAAMRWLQRGGVLGVFPAGEVSHFSLRRGAVADPPWDDAVARLVRRTQAPVVPVFFEGRNSRLFQVAGLLHPRLRTAMLPRELLRHRGETVRLEVGSPIAYARLSGLYDDAGERDGAARVTEYLRLRTMILKGRRPPPRRPASAPAAAQRPIAAPLPAGAVAAEVAALPAGARLAESAALGVYVGRAAELPNVLHEIGRLREQTFRQVGEGTGREIDLDAFDPHYLHLFVWNAAAQQIVGAYRMGQTDVLLQRFGPSGLYTSTLFDFRAPLLSQLDPALELGRSFVVREYQRDYAPLMLLWKGIGRFVAQHPRYRRLFGAVSISDDYHSSTKQLLMAFLKTNNFDAQLAACVHPRNPPRFDRRAGDDARRLAATARSLDDVQELLAEIESDRRTMPVLLRQYLRLNARLLGFNIDPNFGDVLDGLVLVDLTNVERPILNRYFGRDAAAAFLALHGAGSS